MSKETQISYPQKAICPSFTNINMWEKTNGISLSIHVYIDKQSCNLHVDRINPTSAG